MEVKIKQRHDDKGEAWVITTRIPSESGVGIVRFVRGTYSKALVEMYHFLNQYRAIRKARKIGNI